VWWALRKKERAFVDFRALGQREKEEVGDELKWEVSLKGVVVPPNERNRDCRKWGAGTRIGGVYSICMFQKMHDLFNCVNHGEGA
jgi:hypothetical protein